MSPARAKREASSSASGAGEPRRPLNREAVIAAAIELADFEGAGTPSMRQLAERLGVVPMALYKHVADKEDLLNGMVDAVIAAIPDPPPALEGDWRVAVAVKLAATRAVVQQHPWARRAIETRTQRTAAVLRHMEAVTQLFLGGGLSPDLAHHAMHALGNRIWGFSPEMFNDPGSQADSSGSGSARAKAARTRRSEALDPAQFPGILAVSADAQARRPGATGCDEEFEFGFALEVILEGVARRHDSGWTSPGGSQP